MTDAKEHFLKGCYPYTIRRYFELFQISVKVSEEVLELRSSMVGQLVGNLCLNFLQLDCLGNSCSDEWPDKRSVFTFLCQNEIVPHAKTILEEQR